MLPVGAYGLVACSGNAGELPTSSTVPCIHFARLSAGVLRRVPCRVPPDFAWHIRPGTVPFWACLLSCRQIASVGGFSLTTPHHTFTCVDHSRLLNGVAASGSRLTAFPSSLPTPVLSLPKELTTSRLP
jgi:hypothetical protein